MIDLSRFWDFVKIVWMILISIFAPIRVAIIVVMLFFLLNFIVGFKNDDIVHKQPFSIKKAFEGIKLLILYYAIIFIVFSALSLFEEHVLAENSTKFISWVVCYWYLVNVVRNAKEIFPWSKGLKFLYEILTIEVLNMILDRFGFSSKRNKTNINNDNNNDEITEHKESENT